jgi:hypothetical protein
VVQRYVGKNSVMNNVSFTLVGGQVLIGVHSDKQCRGQYCCIHNPSDHHMREWEQNWRPDRRMMERIYKHSDGHPDPDDICIDRSHACDGCCSVAK